MGYYSGGDCIYGRGDYYRGDYYRGDPGIFGTLAKIGKAVGSGAVGFVTGGVQGALTGIKSSLGVTPNPGPPPLPSVQGSTIAPMIIPPAPGSFTGIQAHAGSMGFSIGTGALPITEGEVQGPVGSMTPQGLIPGCQLKGYRPNKSSYYKRSGASTGIRIPKGSVCVKSRRMNPANGRALRKALRRAHAFEKIAMRTIRILHPGKKKRFGGFKRARKRA